VTTRRTKKKEKSAKNKMPRENTGENITAGIYLLIWEGLHLGDEVGRVVEL
jgi:hypothetical protein